MSHYIGGSQANFMEPWEPQNVAQICGLKLPAEEVWKLV